MAGYLLDTNHVQAWIDSAPTFMARLRKSPAENLMFVSTVSLGELECGNRITTSTNPAMRDRCRAFINNLQFIVELRATTRTYYAELMERIWRDNRPASSRTRTERHLVERGIDINDVWIVSMAWEHGLTVLTNDQMAIIRKATGADVRFDDWT